MKAVNIFHFFKIPPSSGRTFFTFYFLLFTFAFLLAPAATQAQPGAPKDAEPPPLKILSKQEKTQLDAVTLVKEHTTLALALMDARLKNAEDLNAKESYAEMFTELGGFHALIENTLNFLNRNDDGSRKVFKNFKKLEMSLRGFLSRLEIIRRELPLKYEFYVRGLVKVVRDARSKAVEPLFGDTTKEN